MRKYLSSAFSERSLREQEYLVAEVVDQFVEEIDSGSGQREGKGEGEGGEPGVLGAEVELVNMFNLTTFDIIGSLAFGESFGGLKAGG